MDSDAPSDDGQQRQTFYDAIGGYATIARIVDRFYEGVAERRGAPAALPRGGPRPGRGAVPAVPGAVLGRPDDVLRAARPPAAADAARAVRGDPAAKEHWLLHFRAGLDEAGLTPEQDAQFWDYVTHAAQFMVNTFEEPA